MKKEIALNYTYLSEHHGGGKDQVGLNLLRGFRDNGVADMLYVICFDYSLELLKSIAPVGIEYIVIKSKNINTGLMRLVNLIYVNSFIIPKIIKKYNIRLIYHLNCTNGLFRLKAKSVVIPHDIKAIAHREIGSQKVPYLKYILYKIIYAMDFYHADGIVAISDFDKNDIETFYPKYKSKIRRIYNPIIVDNIQKVGTCPIDVPYVLAINLQFHHKNVITLIKAYELIKDEVDFKLVLVGNVPKRVEYLKQYVEEHNLASDVLFTGFVSSEEMYRWLTHANLYVNPTMFEGFGMTAVEAMILEVPVLLSGISVNKEVTKERATYYWPPEDEKELAKMLIGSMNEKVDKDELQARKELMIKEYDYKVIAKKYMEYFKMMIGS